LPLADPFNRTSGKDDFDLHFHRRLPGPIRRSERKEVSGLAQMRELFLSLADKTMEEQRETIDATFEDWKGRFGAGGRCVRNWGKGMRNKILILFLLLFPIFGNYFAQEICRDTNCTIFKGAIEYKDLPKKYTGCYIGRHTKDYDFSNIKRKGSAVPRPLKAIDIINPNKVEQERNKYKIGQITNITFLNEGKTVLVYLFNDEGNLKGVYYSNYIPKKFFIYAVFEIKPPYISYYKNGNIKELNTFNTLDERISTIGYYPDQTLRLKADVKGYELEGTITSYFPNGKVEKIALIHKDLIDGYLLTYKEDGKFLKAEFYRENVLDTLSDLTKYNAQLFILKLKAEEENKSVDRQNDIIQKNIELIEKEALKKQREDELKIQEAKITKQKIELELLSKNKVISDLTLREKQNEITKAELFAKQKKQEIENLSKENLIKELNIRNQEAELKKSDAEARINFSKIETLNKENNLKKLEAKQKQEEISKQKFLRNLFIGGFSLLILLVFLIFKSLQQNKRANKIITAQKIEVENQKDEVEKAHHHLEEKNREILDSITYAKRIQSAILPQPKLVKEFLEDSFVLYKPKDIVAGDFYWLEVVGDTVLFAAADCTGHGVPGAMVSVVCNNGLNRAVREFGLLDPRKNTR
jgi:antitoxin component YwqK of YwqJK toxin-antitoxin module